MVNKMMRIEIPESYEFESIDQAVEELGGEDVVLECLKRYFDYASANRKYRENKQEKEKMMKSALEKAGIDIEKLLAERLKS